MAKLIPYTANTQVRQPGSMEGEILIAQDFDQLPDDIAAAFGVRVHTREITHSCCFQPHSAVTQTTGSATDCQGTL